VIAARAPARRGPRPRALLPPPPSLPRFRSQRPGWPARPWGRPRPARARARLQPCHTDQRHDAAGATAPSAAAGPTLLCYLLPTRTPLPPSSHQGRRCPFAAGRPAALVLPPDTHGPDTHTRPRSARALAARPVAESARAGAGICSARGAASDPCTSPGGLAARRANARAAAARPLGAPTICHRPIHHCALTRMWCLALAQRPGAGPRAKKVPARGPARRARARARTVRACVPMPLNPPAWSFWSRAGAPRTLACAPHAMRGRAARPRAGRHPSAPRRPTLGCAHALRPSPPQAQPRPVVTLHQGEGATCWRRCL
jgi:hypothetical protein